MRKILFEQSASDDLFYWAANDIKITKKILSLIEDIQRHPFEGLGKPEPLKFQLKGFWSRRINDEHRLVYKATSDLITIASCRYHYS